MRFQSCTGVSSMITVSYPLQARMDSCCLDNSNWSWVDARDETSMPKTGKQPENNLYNLQYSF